MTDIHVMKYTYTVVIELECDDADAKMAPGSGFPESSGKIEDIVREGLNDILSPYTIEVTGVTEFTTPSSWASKVRGEI